MRKIIFELLNDKRILIEDDFAWIDNIADQLNNNNDFIRINNYIFNKSEIRSVEIKDIPQQV